MKHTSGTSRKTSNPQTLWEYSISVPTGEVESLGAWFQNTLKTNTASVLDVETGSHRIVAYLPEPLADLRALNRQLDARCAAGARVPPKIRARRLVPQNWAESWKRHFKPLSIRNALLIRASWHRQLAKPGQRVIVLDPGLSFGTGHHPTTRFCLSEIVRLARQKSQPSFLDLGAGSGLLALAAARMRYHPVTAIDIDEQAVRIATLNARRNRLDGRVQFLQRNVARLSPKRPTHRSDVVCANLVFDLLVQQRDRIAAQVSAAGHLVLAGILDHQFAHIQEAYTSIGFRLVKARTEREWRSGSFLAPTHGLAARRPHSHPG